MKRSYEISKELSERMDSERIAKLSTPRIKQVRGVISWCILLVLLGGIVSWDAFATKATLSDVKTWVGPFLLFAPGAAALIWLWIMRMLRSTKPFYKGLPAEFWGMRELEISQGMVRLVSPLADTKYSAKLISSVVETQSAVHLVGNSLAGISLPKPAFGREEVEAALKAERPADAPPLLPVS